jgi:hypothetical protein
VWRDWKRTSGCVGCVRGLEVTHGANGWHAHLHTLIFIKDKTAALSQTTTALFEWRWANAVEKHLGEDHVPDDIHGVVLSEPKRDSYLAKMGLVMELTSSATKEAAHGNRSMWRIACDIKDYGLEEDKAIWRAWAEGMKGAKLITWSKGLRKLLGLGTERTDGEIAEEELPAAKVGILSRTLWNEVTGRPGLVVALLEATERGAQEGLAAGGAARGGYDGLVAAVVAHLGEEWREHIVQGGDCMGELRLHRLDWWAECARRRAA